MRVEETKYYQAINPNNETITKQARYIFTNLQIFKEHFINTTHKFYQFYIYSFYYIIL